PATASVRKSSARTRGYGDLTSRAGAATRLSTNTVAATAVDMGTITKRSAADEAVRKNADEAIAYARFGFAAIPTYLDKTRAVRWKSRRTRRHSEATIRHLFTSTDADGLAVILGSASGGLACRDYDEVAPYQGWAASHLDLAATLPTVRTGRGFHVYHRCTNEQFVSL